MSNCSYLLVLLVIIVILFVFAIFLTTNQENKGISTKCGCNKKHRHHHNHHHDYNDYYNRYGYDKYNYLIPLLNNADVMPTSKPPQPVQTSQPVTSEATVFPFPTGSNLQMTPELYTQFYNWLYNNRNLHGQNRYYDSDYSSDSDHSDHSHHGHYKSLKNKKKRHSKKTKKVFV